MGVVLYGCIHWSNSLDCTLKICLIICKLYLSKRLYYQKKRSNRDGALLVPFFPTIGNFCPEFSIPVYLNAFSIYAFILKLYMLLFCMFFRLYLSHTHMCVWMYVFCNLLFLLNIMYMRLIHLFDISSWSCIFKAKCTYVLEYYVIKLSFLFFSVFRLFQNSAAMVLCIYLFVSARALKGGVAGL